MRVFLGAALLLEVAFGLRVAHNITRRQTQEEENMPESAACPDACMAPQCQSGSPSNGGVDLVSEACMHTCSKSYSGVRYCGIGAAYDIGDFVDCTRCAPKPFRGLKLIPTQGISNNGAFLPGKYALDYPIASMAQLPKFGFDSIRIAINSETAMDDGLLEKIKAYFDAIGGTGIICMFDDNANDTSGAFGSGHGDGIVTGAAQMAAMKAAWNRIHEVFRSYPNVKYEIFNEPFGYSKSYPWLYLSDMRELMEGLPEDKCILDGMGYASDVQIVANAGWTGELAWHVYPNWLGAGGRTQEAFSSLVQTSLSGLSEKTYITEFGAALNLANPNYGNYEPSGDAADVNILRGLHDAVLSMKQQGKGIKGIYVMHGMHNSDCYDIWDCANANGRNKIQAILRDFDDSPSGAAPFPTNTDGTCASACTADEPCQTGDWRNGGKRVEVMSGEGACAFTCSSSWDGKRYCGTGSSYELDGSVDCVSCACPARCGWLPCFDDTEVFTVF